MFQWNTREDFWAEVLDADGQFGCVRGRVQPCVTVADRADELLQAHETLVAVETFETMVELLHGSLEGLSAGEVEGVEVPFWQLLGDEMQVFAPLRGRQSRFLWLALRTGPDRDGWYEPLLRGHPGCGPRSFADPYPPMAPNCRRAQSGHWDVHSMAGASVGARYVLRPASGDPHQ